MAIKILYTAHAKAVGGRNGRTESSDKLVAVDLSVPKAMGGPGRAGTTTPEDLFAAGYAACFGGAVDYAAKLKKLTVTDVSVEAAVGIGTTDAGGFGLKVDLTVSLRGLNQKDAESLVHDAHQICPYSNATRNNVEVGLKTVVL